jgi:hypothetical protein
MKFAAAAAGNHQSAPIGPAGENPSTNEATSAYGTARQRRSGRACRLCPGSSDVNLFGYCQRVVNLDA